MGKHMYLGPYVECTYKDKSRKRSVYGCTNERCRMFPKKRDDVGDGKFCSACGTPNGKVKIDEPDRPRAHDVVGDELSEIQSEHLRRDVVILGINVRRAGDPRPDLFRQEEVHIDLREVDPAAEMAWFEKSFARELVKLRKAYATVTVKWGLHQYYL